MMSTSRVVTNIFKGLFKHTDRKLLLEVVGGGIEFAASVEGDKETSLILSYPDVEELLIRLSGRQELIEMDTEKGSLFFMHLPENDKFCVVIETDDSVSCLAFHKKSRTFLVEHLVSLLCTNQ